MKTILIALMIISLNTYAEEELPTVKCESGDIRLTIVESAKREIFVTFQLESALADGLLAKDEVDLIAKFPNSGEMTLVAKLGKNAKDNYLYFQGKRHAVTCK